jgi:hypothetical protein
LKRQQKAKPGKVLRLVGPDVDPYAHMQHTEDFKEAEALAHAHGLGYLSISGVFKLSRLIAAVRKPTTNENHA